MDYFKPFSVQTQAKFYKAESETLRLGGRMEHLSYATYMKSTLRAIDSVFALRMSNEQPVSAVTLIVAADVARWKFNGDVKRCLEVKELFNNTPEATRKATLEALYYIQAIRWVEHTVVPSYQITTNTLLQLHGILSLGAGASAHSQHFRNTYLPHKKGENPANIQKKIEELCDFSNGNYFSPIGQASVIHHAFERIVPFDSLIDRTGLLFAFMPMFRRGLFPSGYVVPICWGCSLEKEYRKQLKDASRDEPTDKLYKTYRDQWAAYNARNTYMGATIANMFIDKTEVLSKSWRKTLKVPVNSALDKLLDLFLAIPQLSVAHAAACIGKSYGATNEAMHVLSKAGIVKETLIDGKERIFTCPQSVALIDAFVAELEKTAGAKNEEM